MLDKEGAAISEAEAELYDRQVSLHRRHNPRTPTAAGTLLKLSRVSFQIRLWGLDAQKRLRASRVLVAGVRGLTVEVAKNLVLAGVSALTLLDHQALSQEDAKINYLAPRDMVRLQQHFIRTRVTSSL